MPMRSGSSLDADAGVLEAERPETDGSREPVPAPSDRRATGEGGRATIWQPRESDPGLEAEFLRLLMVRMEKSQTVYHITVAKALPRASGT